MLHTDRCNVLIVLIVHVFSGSYRTEKANQMRESKQKIQLKVVNLVVVLYAL